MPLLGLFGTVLGLSLWLGSVFFFLFFVTPTLYKRLTPDIAGDVTDILNRWYYYLSWMCGGTMLVAAVPALAHDRNNTVAFMILTGVAVGVTLYAGLVTHPRMRDLRERLRSSAGTEENLYLRDRFDHTTRLSHFLNGCVILLLSAAALALSAVLGAKPS